MYTNKMRAVMADADDGSETAPAVLVTKLVSVDAGHYAQLCEKAGVPIGSNILLNHYRSDESGKKTEFEPFVFSGQTLMLRSDSAPDRELPIHGVLGLGDVPNEVMYDVGGTVIAILVPEVDAPSYTWFVDTPDPAGFTEFAAPIITGLIPEGGSSGVYADVTDIRETTNLIIAVNRLVKIFIYGFVAMLTLIGMTNVISTISTNVRSRTREFAVLKSVGMTSGGLGRMLNLECLLCSARALLFGLPGGLVASFAIYRFMMASTVFTYSLPLLAIAECIVGVFVITWTAMRYSASRLEERSIVEAIRE
jgi:putative ABC transport system permease protein